MFAQIENQKKTICVIGACEGAGATFVATALAFVMGQYRDSVTYLEGSGHGCNHSLPFYELFLDKHISKSRFADLFLHKKNGMPTDNRVNLYENVNWVVRFSSIHEILEPKDVAGEYVIWDNPKECVDASLVLCVIDVLPSKVMASKEKIKMCRDSFGDKVKWVFNSANSEKEIKDAEKFLKVKRDFVISMQPQIDFYKAQGFGFSLLDTACKRNGMLPKLTSKVNAQLEELSQYILVLY